MGSAIEVIDRTTTPDQQTADKRMLQMETVQSRTGTASSGAIIRRRGEANSGAARTNRADFYIRPDM
jgi:hypothetical protein